MNANTADGAAGLLRHPVTRVALIGIILFLAIWPWLGFPWRIPLVALLVLLLAWLETGGVGAVGLARPRSLATTLAWALAATLVCILLIGDVVGPLVEWLMGQEPDYSGYGALEGNFGAAASLLAKAMLSAAIGEEIVYRGFLLHQFSALLGKSRPALAVAVVLGGLVFAVPHWDQGIPGVTTVALTGMLFGGVFFASGRNLWAVILAHALVDIWGVTMLYLGR